MLHRHDDDSSHHQQQQPSRTRQEQAASPPAANSNTRHPFLRARVYSPSSNISGTTSSSSSNNNNDSAASSSSACSCSVCGCACCDLSSITSGSTATTSSSTASSYGTSSSSYASGRSSSNNFASIARSHCPACLGTGTSIVTGLGCTACHGSSPATSSSSSASRASPSCAAVSPSPSRHQQQHNGGKVLSATRTARGEWICDECRVCDMRMKSAYATPSRPPMVGASAADAAASPPSQQRRLDGTPLLRVVQPQRERLTDPGKPPTAAVAAPAAATTVVPPPAATTAAVTESGGKTAVVVAPASAPAQQQQQQHQAAVAVDEQKPVEHAPPPPAEQQQEQPAEQQPLQTSLANELLDSMIQQQHHQQPVAQHSSATEAAYQQPHHHQQQQQHTHRVLIRDCTTQTKAKYFRRRLRDGGTIPPSDREDMDDSDRDLYERSLGVQVNLVELAEQQQQQQDGQEHVAVGEVAEAETSFSVGESQTELKSFRNQEQQLDEATARAELIDAAAQFKKQQQEEENESSRRRDVSCEVDFITPQLQSAALIRLERCQLEEAEQRQQLQDLALDLLFTSLHDTAKELIRNVRFSRDAAQARLHQHRDATSNASIQAMCLSESASRQQIECRWTSAMQNTISVPFLQKRETLKLADLTEATSDKDAQIARLRKQLEEQAVAAAVKEHELRDRLRLALLYGEKANRKVVEPFTTPSISLVDINLPIEVRFSRAHAIAAKAVDLERPVRSHGVYEQEEAELAEAGEMFGI